MHYIKEAHPQRNLPTESNPWSYLPLGRVTSLIMDHAENNPLA